MYKNNWLKRGAVAAVAAGLMLGALPGVAMAATVTNDAVEGVADHPVLTKTWEAPANYLLNDSQKFNFTLKYLDVDPLNGNETADPTWTQNTDATKTGTFDTTTRATVQLTSKWQTNAGEGGTSSDATLAAKDVFGQVMINNGGRSTLDFSKPGIYHFTLQEQDDAKLNKDIVYDKSVHNVDVMVSWDTKEDGTTDFTKTKVQWVSAKDAAGEKETAHITNTYGPQGQLVLTKTVAGTGANENDEFEFKLVLSNVTASTEYKYDVFEGETRVDGGTVKQQTAGNTLKLSSGQRLVVYNLPQGADWKVTELSSDGYTGSATLEGAEPSDELLENEVGAEGNIDIKLDDEKWADTDTVNFRNEKGFAPETGITMNTLPFVGVAAVAAAGAVTLVISRKRRAGEEF